MDTCTSDKQPSTNMVKECVKELQVDCTSPRQLQGSYCISHFVSPHTYPHTLLDPDDFVVNQDSLELVFPPGAPQNTQICFDVNATDDTLVEDDETVLVQTEATNSLDVIMQNTSAMEVDGMSIATAVITIVDDDGKCTCSVHYISEHETYQVLRTAQH